MTDREIRIAVLRESRRRNDTDVKQLMEITGERELTIVGVLSEMEDFGFVKKTTVPIASSTAGKTVFEFDPRAKYTIDLLEPREGRHA